MKPGDAISIIETDVNLEFEAPKDYKEPTRQPAAPLQPLAAAAGGEAGPSSTGGAAAAGEEEAEPEEPKFIAFQGSGRRLDGKASSSSSSPAAASGAGPSSAAAAAARRAAGAGGNSAAVGGSKPGTFVSTGNRLLDKLEMDKVGGGWGEGTVAPHELWSRGGTVCNSGSPCTQSLGDSTPPPGVRCGGGGLHQSGHHFCTSLGTSMSVCTRQPMDYFPISSPLCSRCIFGRRITGIVVISCV